MDEKLDLILQELQSIKQEMGAMKQEMESVKQEIGAMKEEMESVKQEIGAMKQEMLALKSGQKELHLITRAIRDRQEETDAKLESLSMDVHQLHGKVEQNSEKLNFLIEDHKSVHEILGEHEISIRSMRRILTKIG